MRGLSIEQIKKRKNGLDVWRDLEYYAGAGYESITPEDLELFHWYGIYEQRPGRGHFMLRIRIPGGALNVEQARTIAGASRDFARGFMDITVRQNIQFHWITVADIPEIVRRLHEVGLSIASTGGDTVRNVVQCPLAGRVKGELFDTRDLTIELDRRLARDRRYSNLPRKFKIGLCGCHRHCTIPSLQDIGLYAAMKTGEKKATGFNLLVGGGLSVKPQFAVPLDAWVPSAQVVDVCEALVKIFDRHGSRKNRSQARLKFLLDASTAPAFRKLLTDELGRDLEPAATATPPEGYFREHTGPGEQKQRGQHFLSLASIAGRISAEDLFVAAGTAKSFGGGAVLLTPMQNIIVPDIATPRLNEAQGRLDFAPTTRRDISGLRSGCIACTGSEFCGHALTDTKKTAEDILNHLDLNRVVPAVPLKIGLSGCPNDCGQAQMSDIGLFGVKGDESDDGRDAFNIIINGKNNLGKPGRTTIKSRVPADQIAKVLKELIEVFNAKRTKTETFAEFAKRAFTDEGIEFTI